MAELALNSSLIDEYIGYKFQDNYDNAKVRRLLKYIQPFEIRTDHSDFFSDPSTAGQFIDPLAKIIPPCEDEDLVKNTSLKLMLVDNNTHQTYVTLNINNQYEKLGLRFGGIYPNQMDKNKAKQHIKALLSDGGYVKISDSYIERSSAQWGVNKTILEDIIPHKQIDVVIESGSVLNNHSPLSGSKKTEIGALCNQWNISCSQYNDTLLHDRYIETNKVKILLSSGLYNLSSSSNKDFTYVIEIK